MNFKQVFIFSLLMSCIMAVIMSFVITFSILGFSSDYFLQNWLQNGIRGFCLAFPSTFFVTPIVNKLTDAIFVKLKNPTLLKRRIIFAFLMPAFMDLIIASISTISTVGFSNKFLFIFVKSYIAGFVVAVPLSFFISYSVMNFVKLTIK